MGRKVYLAILPGKKFDWIDIYCTDHTQIGWLMDDAIRHKYPKSILLYVKRDAIDEPYKFTILLNSGVVDTKSIVDWLSEKTVERGWVLATESVNLYMLEID